MIIPASIIFGVSLVGIIALLVRRIRSASYMSDTQLRYLLLKEPPLFLQMVYMVRHGIQIFWYRYCRDILFAFIMRQISRVRIFVLHIEHNLFRMGHTIRERSIRRKPSVYWRDLHGWHKAARWSKRKKNVMSEKRIEVREYTPDDFAPVEISRK
ncbi:MAG: hypothetical protein COU90_03145 [Candidatus Ryanbacteria bacterium CG10_big_fil_rev_8_21_14_0_10_43_42]|uniref:Uncharacterized protein n=1 Tax=Candidatus Ryanbacteria bacterium CG10_big_fil_rev_8_21_14_0_10_43_42 TaxID=1974864 RepID=A0A2M8KWV7_9BACT|nr:MAG: hypothetical protein COU90_03145 [Candidatus Ryanbacteria bacterium CG10_big_fil_rev_8_21_14_0_10_43_42]